MPNELIDLVKFNEYAVDVTNIYAEPYYHVYRTRDGVEHIMLNDKLQEVKQELNELLKHHDINDVTDFIKDCIGSQHYLNSYFNGKPEFYAAALSLLLGDAIDRTGYTTNLSEDELKEKISNIKVGITYDFSTGCFKRYFPNIKVINSPEEVSNYDLIIVPGGDDVNPSYYGESNMYSSFNSERDNTEIPIVKAAIRLSRKMYGVCRGHQLINILYGCEFLQDILYAELEPHEANHSLDFVSNGVLKTFFYNKDVISTHHQGVRKVTNRSIRAICYHKGVVEGCENDHIITTQFHPEFGSIFSGDSNVEFFEYLKKWAFLK